MLKEEKSPVDFLRLDLAYLPSGFVCLLSFPLLTIISIIGQAEEKEDTENSDNPCWCFSHTAPRVLRAPGDTPLSFVRVSCNDLHFVYNYVSATIFKKEQFTNSE